MKTNTTQLIPRLSHGSGFRLFLQAELARRCSANAQYSLRSFALQLGINHSTLSQLLRGKRALTPRTIERLGAQLGLAQTEVERFIVRERLAATGASPISRQIRQLTMDTVSLLSDAVHRAILELTRLDDFKPDSRWIARVLNLPVDEVNIAISRLARLGLLAMTDHSTWVDRSDAAGLGQDAFANLIVQRLSEQVRHLSTQSEPPIHTGATGANSTRAIITAAQLQQIVELIERFQDDPAPTDADAREAEVRYQLEMLVSPIHSTDQI